MKFDSILKHKKYRISRNVNPRKPFYFKKGFFKFTPFKILNIFLLLALVLGIYFFLFSGFYNITNIEVIGNQIISTDDILDISNNYLSQKSFLIFKNKNLFFFSKSELKRKIGEYVLLNDLKIEKILPNTIRITLKEKDVAFKWISNNQEYLVDKNGVIIKKFYTLNLPKIYQLQSTTVPANSQDDSFFRIYNSANEDVNLGDTVLRSEDINFISNLQEKIKQFDYIKLRDVSVPNNLPKYISVNTESGWFIFFNLSETVDDQLNRFNLLVNGKIKKENVNRLDYIDLRLGESVYYKFK